MTLDEILAALAEHPRDAVVAGLQSKQQGIFQVIFDKGHGVAAAKADAAKATADGKIAELTQTIAAKDATIKQLEEKTPEVTTLRTQFETQIQTLQNKHKEQLDAAAAALEGERRSRVLSDLRADLVAEGVDAEYADLITSKPETAKRIRFSKDGVAEILQPEGNIPFAVSKPEEARSMLAKELKGKVPEKFLLVNSDRGSATENSGGGGAGGGKGDFYKGIREDAKTRQTKTEAAVPVEARLGMTQ